MHAFPSDTGMFSGDWREGLGGSRYQSCIKRKLPYLLEDKVELSLSLVHLVTFQETEVSSPQQMIGIVHDDLVSCGVEECGLHRDKVFIKYL